MSKLERRLESREEFKKNTSVEVDLFLCLCFTSHQQQGHLETAPPFTKDVKLGKYTVPTGNWTLGCRMAAGPLCYRCAMQAPEVDFYWLNNI